MPITITPEYVSPYSRSHSGSNQTLGYFTAFQASGFMAATFSLVMFLCTTLKTKAFSQNKIKPYLNMQLTGKLISKPWMLLKSIEKQK